MGMQAVVLIMNAVDTGSLLDMKLIAKHNLIDPDFLPIGDNVTMEPDDPAIAAE
ncbi:hypothetical protein [Domibacillus robiginosus]|uniref:hypothetical protein n=1 Tax=Domibacillus robiginosus TaxID=1071054 RepID=UPI000AD9710F|nr:hypothetical protein [Domibacillus robiginosus]